MIKKINKRYNVISKIIVIPSIVLSLCWASPAVAHIPRPRVLPGATSDYKIDLQGYGGASWITTVSGAFGDWNNLMQQFVLLANANSAHVISQSPTLLAPNVLAETAILLLPISTVIDDWDMTINTRGGDLAFFDGTQNGGVLPANYFDLRSVMRHEIGHALGLCHSESSSTLLMFLSFGPGELRTMDGDALSGERYIYDNAYTGVGPEHGANQSCVGTGPVVAGTYDDQQTYLTYGGRTDSWGKFNVALSAFGTLSRIGNANLVGAKANLAFVGSRVSLLYSMGPDRGQTQVYIDGGLVSQFSGFAPEYRRQIIRTWGVSPGSHKLEIRSGGGGLVDVDAVAVDIAQVGAGTYDNTNAQLRFIGPNWANDPNAVGAYNNTLSFSHFPGELMRFTFTGNSITYFFSKASNRGKAIITIDGINKGEFDLYSAAFQFQQSLTFAGLGVGTHVIDVQVSTNKNPQSTDLFVDVDKLLVQ